MLKCSLEEEYIYFADLVGKKFNIRKRMRIYLEKEKK